MSVIRTASFDQRGNILEIRLEAEGGLVGRGAVENAEDPAAVLASLAGRDPFDLHGLRQISVPHPLLGAAIETAYFDLQAQSCGLTLAHMLGGAFQERISLGMRPDAAEMAMAIDNLDELAHALRAQSLDVWLADPIVLGGPSAFLKGLALARTYLIDVAIDARRHGAIGEALAMQLAASSRLVNAGVLVASGETGTRMVSQAPGLGL